MKILFITKESLSYDNAPSSRILNLKKVLEQYHSVYVIAKGREKHSDYHLKSIPVEGTDFISNQVFKIWMILYVLYLVARKKVNYVVARQYHYIIFLYPWKWLFNFRLIYDMHCFRYKELETEGRHVKSYFNRVFEPLAHKMSDNIAAISPGIMDDLSPELRKKAFLLPNGVDVEQIKSVRPGEKVLRKYRIPDKRIVGFIGNWMPWVDVSTVVKASKYLGKDTAVLIVGEDYQEKEFPLFKAKYPNVIMTGKIPHEEAVQLLKRMDICILPYRKEYVIKHLSIRKTFEYLSAGKPIIMSDSNISEKQFLREKENMVLYTPENPRDLAAKIRMLLDDRDLMKRLSANNSRLSERFTWENQVNSSEILKILRTYDLLKESKAPEGTVSIIIKALNEEKYIERCIRSALAALSGLKGEVILVDSFSDDRTVEIASRFPVRILQLKNKKDRCCGIGPQTGYLYSKGDFIYILDGDMVLDRDFIRKALPYFNDPGIAGVGGNIHEQSASKLVFQVRTKSHIVNHTTEVPQLGMGGLYSRKALENVGYFSNPYFYAYEEYDLGAELSGKGYAMLRIPEKMIEHFGDDTPSIVTIYNRMRSRYLLGSGQYLRRSIGRRHFMRTLWELRIYVSSLLWMLMTVAAFASLVYTSSLMKAYIYVSLAILLVLLAIKRNLYKLLFSIVSWSSQAAGMFLGCFLPSRDPGTYKPDVTIIKNERGEKEWVKAR